LKKIKEEQEKKSREIYDKEYQEQLMKDRDKVKVNNKAEQERQANVNTKQANKSGSVNKSTTMPLKEFGEEVWVDYVKFNSELDDKLSDETKTAAELKAIEIEANYEKLKLHQDFNTKFSKIIDNLDWKK
jgi:hypothetical protein